MPIFFQMFACERAISGIENTNEQLEPWKVSVNLFLPTKFMNTMYKSNMLWHPGPEQQHTNMSTLHYKEQNTLVEIWWEIFSLVYFSER